jgi:hypothetical protein
MCALTMTTAMFAIKVATCRGGYYMGRDGRATDVVWIYSIVMNSILCFSLLVFDA